MPIITLNGKSYVAESVAEYLIQPLSDAIRTTGVQQRSDNRKLNKYIFANWWETGLGCHRLRRDRMTEHGDRTAQHVGGLRDADCETRFQAMITLPLLNQSETHATPADHGAGFVHVGGELIQLFEEEYDAGNVLSAVSRKFDASDDTWKDVSTSDPTFNSISSDADTASSSASANLTVQSTNPNPCVVAYIACDQTETISTVTFAGTAMTEGLTVEVASLRAAIYYLPNPPTGTNALSVTFSGATDYSVAVADYYHCDQRHPFRSFGSDSSGAGADSVSANATVWDDDLVVGMAVDSDPTGTWSYGTDQTERADNQGSGHALAVTDERASSYTASFDHSYTFTPDVSGADDIIMVFGVLAAPNSTISLGDSAGTGARIFDATVHKGRAYAVGSAAASSEKKFMVWSSGDGSAWVEEDGTNWPTSDYITTTVTRRNLFTDRVAAIESFDNYVVVALFEDPVSDGGVASRAHVGYSTDQGTTWTFNSDLRIPCTSTPNLKFVVYRDAFEAYTPPALCLATSENTYILDLANNTYAALLPRNILTGTSGEALAATVASDGNLYLSKEFGDIIQVSVPTTGTVIIKNIGPQTKAHGEDGDGLVSARQGHANFIYGEDPTWLFVAYGGHAANKNASILCMDYEHLAWHSFYKDSTANQDCYALVISSEGDGTDRLHAVTEGASASTCFMFEHPRVSNVTGVSQQFKASGYIEWSEDDLGDPHADSAAFTGRVDCDGLNSAATVEAGNGSNTVHIEHEYGVNGAAYTNVSNFGFYTSDDLVLFFGKTNQNIPSQDEGGTPVGVSAKTLRNRLVFYRDGTNTNTPQLKEFQIEARNKLLVLQGWEITVNLAKTLDMNEAADTEAVITNLETVRDSVPLVAFEIGESGTRYVEMVTSSLKVNLVEPGGGDGLQLGQRAGTVTFRVEEVQVT
jgi:hypothetical protein